MNNIDFKHINHLVTLLCKKVTGTSSAVEEEETEAWLSGSERRRRFFSHLSDPAFHLEEARRRQSADTEAAAQRMAQRIERYERWQTWRRRAVRLSGVAAVVLTIFGATLWYQRYTRVTPPSLNSAELAAIGRSRDVSEPQAHIERASAAHPVVTNADIERYDIDPDFAEALTQGRKLTTFVDKEYWTTLDDGTVVHLSASSRLVHPEHFSGSQRDVILDGEAYFIVAHDKSRPFVVHTPHGTVKEYGTKFHVNTNANAGKETEVVLVEGSISVTGATASEQMLEPGERAVLTASATTVQPTDTVPYVAWHTGSYTFNDARLQYVLDILCHWYGCQAEYSSAAAARERVTGNFDRGESFDDIIEALSAVTGLNIVRRGHTVVVGE